MPAVSRNQAIATAIAEHEPGKLYSRNQGMLKMSQSQLHDFAATKRRGLPAKAKRGKTVPLSSLRRAKMGNMAMMGGM